MCNDDVNIFASQHNYHDMPAQKTRIQKPTASVASPTMSRIAAPMQLLPTKTGATPTRSPARSPAKQQAIAARRKEALVENLEQESM